MKEFSVRGESIAAIVLAAGRSRRFGDDKRRALLNDQSLLQCSLSTPLRLGLPTLLVLRPDDKKNTRELLGQYLGHKNLSISFADKADLGMGYSLAHAIKQLPDVTAAMILLADMPWIESSTLEILAQSIVAGKIIVPTFGGRWGHPVLFSKYWFDQMSELIGDRGARSLLSENSAAIIEVAVDDEGILRDVDVPSAMPRPISGTAIIDKKVR